MKNIRNHFIPRLLGAAIAAAALVTPAIASAQYDPSYAQSDQDGGQNQQIQGTVSGINGTWNISVSDANGYTDSIELHQGTIINPTGLTLEPGMNVTIDGYADGSNFDAVEIDTPYQYSGPAPVAVYYGAGDWYPGYAYGWGPSFSLFFDVNTRSFERRSFDYDGRARQAYAPPSGWQNRPHGYIGNSNVRSMEQRGRTEGGYQQRSYAQPQGRSSYAQSQQRSYAQPQQRSFAQPQQRSYAQPEQRNFAQPQQRSFAQPQQQQRSFAPQQRSFSAPAQRSAPAGRGGGGAQGGGRHR